MSIRTCQWVVWSLALVSTGLAIGSGLLTFVGGAQFATDVADLVGGTLYATSPIVAAALSVLIVARQPRNPVGWLFGSIGLAIAVETFVQAYAAYAMMVHPGRLPGGVIAAVLQNALWPAQWSFLVLLLLLFPNGHLVSPRWRPVAWLAVVIPATLVSLSAVYPGPLQPFESLPNPIGLPGAPGDLLRQLDLSKAANLTAVPFLAAVISIVVRFRRSVGDERQQLKWLAYASGLAFASQAAGAIALPPSVGNLVGNLAMYSLPVAIGVAMLRYHLYDIDLIIRRTLVYGALTATLAAVYFGGVVLLQQLFRTIVGQTSDLAIVGSTLAIAALFQTLRYRIQRTIDRRFYRRRYDATRVLAGFGATLRDEVDLSQLTDHLLAVVEDTMQPAQVSLWLNPVATARSFTASRAASPRRPA
jgi:hypothetical protein